MTFSLLFIVSMAWFAFAYAVKGGQGAYFFKNWEKENPLSHKLSSTLIVSVGLCLATVFYQLNLGVAPLAWQSVLLVMMGWVLSIAPSLGEEYGALMLRPDNYAAWMPDIKTVHIFGRKFQWKEGHEYGFKKAIQRGVWIGACMTAVTGYVPFIYFSLAFVPLAYFCLNYASRKILDPWAWSEVVIGAVCYGIPFAMMVGGNA